MTDRENPTDVHSCVAQPLTGASSAECCGDALVHSHCQSVTVAAGETE